MDIGQVAARDLAILVSIALPFTAGLCAALAWIVGRQDRQHHENREQLRQLHDDILRVTGDRMEDLADRLARIERMVDQWQGFERRKNT